MELSRPERTAKRRSWKTLAPGTVADLGFSDSYTTAEFERLKLGLIPEQMEDKWFIFFEDPWLYFHRSWTGLAVFGVQLGPSEEGVAVMNSWVSREIRDGRGPGTEYERALLRFLIDALLLGENTPFPIPDNLAANLPPGVHQFHMVGRAYPEVAFPASQSDDLIQSWWTRASRWMRRSR